MLFLLVFNRVYRLEIQSVMLVFLTPLVKYCSSNLLTSSPPPSSPLFPVRLSTGLCFIQYVTMGGGGGRVVWRAYTGVIRCVFDQIPNLQNCFTTPNKNPGGRGPQTDKHLPPSPFTGQFLRKADIYAYKDPLTPLRGLY
jgi:hypothetical protein